MDSSLTPLQPISRDEIEQLYSGYRGILQTMTPAQLAAELASLGRMIEQDQEARKASLLLSMSNSLIDQPVQHSTEPGIQSPDSHRPMDRGAAASAPATRPQSSPLELLLGSSRTGPRLAAKLVLNDARRRARSSSGG